ncbi:MAG: hypothetical protein V9E85_08770 [Candidatus Nanopelagicales bacterium]
MATEVTPAPATVSRPWNVTLVAILGIILSISGVLTSIAAIFASGNAMARADVGASKSVLLTIGFVGLIFAVLMFVLWLRFLKGSRISRTLLAILVVLHIVLGFAATGSAHTISGGIGYVFVPAFEIVVLILMFAGHRTAEFFAKAQ